MDGEHQGRLETGVTIEQRGTRLGCLEATGQKHRPTIKLRTVADEEGINIKSFH